MKKLFLSTLLLIGVFAMPVALGGVIFDSLTAESVGYDSIWGSVSNESPGPSPISISFTGVNANLTSVELLLAKTDESSGLVSVDLYSDDNHEPGLFLQTIGTIDDSLLSFDLSAVKFSGFAPYALSEGVRYWISVVSDVGSTAVFGYTPDITGIGVNGEYVRSFGSTYYTTVLNADYQARITTDAPATISEPNVLSLFGLGLIGVYVGGSKKKRCES